MRHRLMLSAIIGSLATGHVNASEWTGFYAGVFAGVGNSTSSWRGRDNDSIGSIAISGDLARNGGYFGGFAGYNHQFGTYVSGLEVDYGVFKSKKSRTLDGMEGLDLESSTDALGSVRARLGVALAPKLLMYGTGGYAFQSAEHVWDDKGINDLEPAKIGLKSGWVVGGGLEYALSAHVLLRAEGLFYRFSGNGGVAPNGENDSFSVKQDIAVGRVGVSYKF
jgi:outer membrane immunogenic protein